MANLKVKINNEPFMEAMLQRTMCGGRVGVCPGCCKQEINVNAKCSVK
jgi:hypothetical protein